MAFILGHMHGEPQYFELDGKRVYINDIPQPIKNVTQEEVDAIEKELASIPEDDSNPGYEALRNTKRISFLISLMDRTFGDDCMAYIEHMIGHLHHEVAAYLGEEDVDVLGSVRAEAELNCKSQTC